jgi:hypothetical protein
MSHFLPPMCFHFPTWKTRVGTVSVSVSVSVHVGWQLSTVVYGVRSMAVVQSCGESILVVNWKSAHLYFWNTHITFDTLTFLMATAIFVSWQPGSGALFNIMQCIHHDMFISRSLNQLIETSVQFRLTSGSLRNKCPSVLLPCVIYCIIHQCQWSDPW